MQYSSVASTAVFSGKYCCFFQPALQQAWQSRHTFPEKYEEGGNYWINNNQDTCVLPDKWSTGSPLHFHRSSQLAHHTGYQPLKPIETMFTLTCSNIPRYQAGSELVRQTWERLKYDTEQTEGRGHCMGLIFSFQLMSGWKNFSTLLCLFSSQSPVLLFQLLHLLLCLALQPKYFLENESNMELLICGTRDAYHLLLSRLPFLLLLGQSCHLLLIVLA